MSYGAKVPSHSSKDPGLPGASRSGPGKPAAKRLYDERVTARVLTAAELNRALLARQQLLKRARNPIPEVLERVGGLQTQYAPSAYIGLWSRVDRFRRRNLTRALERRRVVQATLMRATIHVVSAADYPALAAATRRFRREWWMRIHRDHLKGFTYEALAAMVDDLLADGPMKRRELVDALVSAGYPKQAWEGLGHWIDLVRVPPSGTWESRRADLFGLAESWLGPCEVTESEGLEFLLRRYLRAFGPATISSAANWGGVPVGALQPIADRMKLRQFRDEDGADLFDLPRAPLPPGDTAAPVRFLPTWDATLLAHSRRGGILPEEYRTMIFTNTNPHSVPTFLVDGSVAGTWRYRNGGIDIEPFHPLPPRHRRAVEEEVDALAAFHADP
jgi:hypothetical protein